MFRIIESACKDVKVVKLFSFMCLAVFASCSSDGSQSCVMNRSPKTEHELKFISEIPLSYSGFDAYLLASHLRKFGRKEGLSPLETKELKEFLNQFYAMQSVLGSQSVHGGPNYIENCVIAKHYCDAISRWPNSLSAKYIWIQNANKNLKACLSSEKIKASKTVSLYRQLESKIGNQRLKKILQDIKPETEQIMKNKEQEETKNDEDAVQHYEKAVRYNACAAMDLAKFLPMFSPMPGLINAQIYAVTNSKTPDILGCVGYLDYTSVKNTAISSAQRKRAGAALLNSIRILKDTSTPLTIDYLNMAYGVANTLKKMGPSYDVHADDFIDAGLNKLLKEKSITDIDRLWAQTYTGELVDSGWALPINQIRQVVSKYDLVTFIRKRDAEGGWTLSAQDQLYFEKLERFLKTR